MDEIVAEIELSYNPRARISELPVVRESMDAYRMFLRTWDRTKLFFVEHFKVMLLNRAGRVLGICTVSTGCQAYTPIDIKLIFGLALKGNAGQIILAHNHPSGNITPSKDDIAITERIKEAGKLLDIFLYDHLIITDDGYYSFADERAI